MMACNYSCLYSGLTIVGKYTLLTAIMGVVFWELRNLQWVYRAATTCNYSCGLTIVGKYTL